MRLGGPLFGHEYSVCWSGPLFGLYGFDCWSCPLLGHTVVMTVTDC